MISYCVSERRGNTSADLLYGSVRHGLTVCHPEPQVKDLALESEILFAA
jgi:hypothetical protein